MRLEKYEKATKIFNTCLKHQPDYWAAYAQLAYIYGISGQEKKAKTAVKKLLILVPDYSIKKIIENSPSKNQDLLDRVAVIFRKAGLPEQ